MKQNLHAIQHKNVYLPLGVVMANPIVKMVPMNWIVMDVSSVHHY